KTRGLDLIYLAAPTTTDERLKTIGQATSGYLYYVSLKGITGSSKLDTTEVANRIGHIRQHVSVPICVGFGIRTAEDAAAISSTADGSIVGTVLVSQVEALINDPAKIPDALQSILKPMREAMDAKA
ncbi:MAG: tryptophan synthase subunit alpha, partial [Gammaproteobacteria bacterium]|nr:tryptophan synthase subunit alpha [Gammaproteobacteria bacterium]